MSENNDLPWFKFYPKDFMGDKNVQRMSPLEVGVYIKLLCHQWEAGSVPVCRETAGRIAGCTTEEIEEVWPKIADLFERIPNTDEMRNPRLHKEREKAIERRERAKKAGKASGRSRSSEQNAEQNAERPVQQNAEQNAERPVQQNAEQNAELKGERKGEPHARSVSDVQSTEVQSTDNQKTDVQKTEKTSDSSESALASASDQVRANTPAKKKKKSLDILDVFVQKNEPGEIDGGDVVGLWLSFRDERPPEKQLKKQGAAAKRLADDYTPEEIARSMYGIQYLYPHSDGEAWDLFDLERKFQKCFDQARSEIESNTLKPEIERTMEAIEDL